MNCVDDREGGWSCVPRPAPGLPTRQHCPRCHGVLPDLLSQHVRYYMSKKSCPKSQNFDKAHLFLLFFFRDDVVPYSDWSIGFLEGPEGIQGPWTALVRLLFYPLCRLCIETIKLIKIAAWAWESRAVDSSPSTGKYESMTQYIGHLVSQ